MVFLEEGTAWRKAQWWKEQGMFQALKEGHEGWNCVSSVGSFALSQSPCSCLSRVTVCLFPFPAGFAPSFLATEVFSMCWIVITTRVTTSISGSGALMPRPSRCRVSAGSSSERWMCACLEQRSCGGCYMLSSASSGNPMWTQHLCEPVHACIFSRKN